MRRHPDARTQNSHDLLAGAAADVRGGLRRLRVGSEQEDKGGSTSSASAIDAAFLAKADDACEPYATYTRTNFLELEHFNRYAPDPEVLPQVADHLEKNPAYRDLVSDLEALGDPETGAAAWATVLDDFRATAQTVTDEIAAARGADAEGFSSRVAQLEQETSKLLTDFQPAGLSGSSCSQAEGDPLKSETAGG